ncbi:dynein light intermediate chain [Cavenderia fasciculata]|uniref:Dynein light intermediate chain n=1 Tax=Cavenderia fasciculata TaxID=261658 RepID=F4Q459_CACFS|nr:dynein light intermediate chain [Cavenderia fasciculata]EGG17761.1 dynein light intermediate chain [Cavenderia fasciculata]|eukprot:XP_004356245.1 dynein light intermediate chain [Cavenderia fasciculata]
MSHQQDEEEDIWGNILRESANKTNYFETKNVVMMGDRTSGSSSLLSKFQPISDVEKAKGIALSYTFTDVFEDDSSEDPIARTNFWTLEGETEHNELLKFALNSDNIANSMVVITLDFSQPWNIVDSLKRWLHILEEHIKTIATSSNNKGLFGSLQDKLLIKWHDYVEPSQSLTAAAANTTNNNNNNPLLSNAQKKKKRKINSTIEDTSVLPPLGENILTKNLGVPILVVCCKSDSVVMLEKDFSFKDDLFDYIQQYLRRICLQYGAGLIYTSARKEINCDVALEYIENILFGFELKSRTQLLEKDQIFVPSGWDTLAKITLDFDNQKVCRDVEELYENVVKKPSIIKRREMNQASAVLAEDDQEFLNKIKNSLDQESPMQSKSSNPAGAGSDGNTPETPKVVETSSPPNLRSSTTSTSSSSTSSPSTAATGAAPSAEKAVLANFFTSLMSKDKLTNRSASKDLKASLTSPPTSNVRADAQKELEKIKQNKK